MPIISSPPQFPGVSSLPKPVQGAIEAIFPKDSLPMPGAMAVRTGYPKPDGILGQLLERAGLKSGTGTALTPGESALLERFNPAKLGEASLRQHLGPQSVPAPPKALPEQVPDNVLEHLFGDRPKFTPWKGLKDILGKVGL